MPKIAEVVALFTLSVLVGCAPAQSPYRPYPVVGSSAPSYAQIQERENLSVRAFLKNDPQAEYQLGMDKLPFDKPLALTLLRSSAAQGNADAQRVVNAIDEEDRAVSKVQADAEAERQRAANAQRKAEEAAACSAATQAAERGDPKAEYRLGYYYDSGTRCGDTDYQKAMYWYRKAANHGSAEAENNIGVLYARGQGVPKDIEQAKIWYGKAAAHGDQLAQQNLEVLTHPADQRSVVRRYEGDSGPSATECAFYDMVDAPMFSGMAGCPPF